MGETEEKLVLRELYCLLLLYSFKNINNSLNNVLFIALWVEVIQQKLLNYFENAVKINK